MTLSYVSITCTPSPSTLDILTSRQHQRRNNHLAIGATLSHLPTPDIILHLHNCAQIRRQIHYLFYDMGAGQSKQVAASAVGREKGEIAQCMSKLSVAGKMQEALETYVCVDEDREYRISRLESFLSSMSTTDRAPYAYSPNLLLIEKKYHFVYIRDETLGKGVAGRSQGNRYSACCIGLYGYPPNIHTSLEPARLIRSIIALPHNHYS